MNAKRGWVVVLGLGVVIVAVVLARAGFSGEGAIGEKKTGKKPKPQNTEKAVAIAEETKAIRKQIADFSKAFNKGDLDGIMAFWAENAEYINENGKTTRGKEALREMIKKGLSGIKGQKHSIETKSVRLLKPDVAIEDSTLKMTAADGSVESGPYSALWLKIGGKWLISSVRDLPNETDPSQSIAYQRLKGLGWMVGEWTDKSGDTLMTCKWAPGQVALVMEYIISREGGKKFYISQRIGWDPVNEEVRSWFFDSDGGYGEAVWTRNGNKWEIECEGYTADGLTGTSSNVWKFIDQNTALWTAKDREVDEQPLPDLEVKYTRKTKGKGK